MDGMGCFLWMQVIVIYKARSFTMSPLGPEAPVGPCRVKRERMN